MAIQVKENKKDTGVTVTVDLNNGHLEALNNIKSYYRIKNFEETLSFLLAVMEKTEGKGVPIDGKVFKPSREIIN